MRSLGATFRDVPNKARLLPIEIEQPGTFFDSVAAFRPGAAEEYWFRGHGDFRWGLTPGALRPGLVRDRERALGLMDEFRRRSGPLLDRPPPPEDTLGWMQWAQHYGLPTRLLDWTRSPAIALYFACLQPARDGAVYVLNPKDVNRAAGVEAGRLLDGHRDLDQLEPYFALNARVDRRGPHTVAMLPTINNPRMAVQRCTFTLHGSRSITIKDVPDSYFHFVGIRAHHKRAIMAQLETIGFDEPSLFPEPEKLCRHLRRPLGL